MNNLEILKQDLKNLNLQFDLVEKYKSELEILKTINLKFNEKTKNKVKLLNKELKGEIIVEFNTGKNYNGKQWKTLRLLFPTIENTEYLNNYKYYIFLNCADNYNSYTFSLESLVTKIIKQIRSKESLINFNESNKSKYELALLKINEIKEILNSLLTDNETEQNSDINHAKWILRNEIKENIKNLLRID